MSVGYLSKQASKNKKPKTAGASGPAALIGSKAIALEASSISDFKERPDYKLRQLLRIASAPL